MAVSEARLQEVYAKVTEETDTRFKQGDESLQAINSELVAKIVALEQMIQNVKTETERELLVRFQSLKDETERELTIALQAGLGSCAAKAQESTKVARAC